jgi:hypothetical protein
MIPPESWKNLKKKIKPEGNTLCLSSYVLGTKAIKSECSEVLRATPRQVPE